ncbi:MAG TPA: ABC transporter transmembrane domain-containing protein, partial [Vicinamibacterales bacterium]|nr:ABC transporter transmembrane domain-containing protein [Vicinamibacterales bacterium]
MSPLRRLLRYAAPYRGRFAVALAAMAAYGGASAWLAYLVKPIFDEVLIKQQSLSTVAWAILAAYLLKGLGSYASSYLMADVGQHVVLDLRNEMFRRTLGQSAAFFKSRSTGQLLSRLTNDIAQVQQVVSE